MSMIFEKGAFLLRNAMGTAKAEGDNWEMSMINGHTPAVQCVATGLTFALSWTDIIDLAKAAGADKEPA